MTPQIPHVQTYSCTLRLAPSVFHVFHAISCTTNLPHQLCTFISPHLCCLAFSSAVGHRVMRLYMFCSYSCVPFLCLVYSLCLLSPYHSVLLSLTNPPSPNIKAAFPLCLFSTDTLSRCCIVHFPVFDPDLPCTQSDLFTFTDELTGDIFL